MKVLMLTPYLPYPPSSGGQIRSYNLIKYLSKKHQITLFSLIKYQEERKYVDNLKKYCKEVYLFQRAEKPWTLTNVLKTGFSLHPFLVVRNFSQPEKDALEKILAEERFDIIHAETFYVSPHIPKTDTPIVLVDQTIEYQVYQHFVKNFKLFFLRPILYLDVLKIKYWEEYYWKKAAGVVAVSERDASLMRKLVNGLDVSVVPNGVGDDLMDKVNIHYSKNILLMGNYAWLQNIEAAKILIQQVFPLILKEMPDARLVISGQNTEKIVNLKTKGVTFQDLRIDDVSGVKKAYRENGVLVAPLYGPGGTRLKILGAMAAKMPVVTTSVGVEGIEAEHGVSVLCGERPEDLARLVIELFSDRKLYNKIAENARLLVENKYQYKAIAENLSQIYERLGQKT